LPIWKVHAKVTTPQGKVIGMNNEAQAREAMDALAEVRLRQEYVIEATLVPVWYWWAVAVGAVLLGAAVDTRESVVIPAVAIVFAIGVSLLTAWIVFGGLAHVKVRDDFLGAEGAAAIAGFVMLLVAASLAIAFALQAASFRYPGTASTLACAVGLVVGGPILMGRLQRIMLRRRAGNGR
jgi:hypothetical protein